MPKIFLFLSFLFCFQFGYGDDFQRKIKWLQPMSFEGSVFSPDGIPRWFGSFDLNSPSAEIQIKDPVFESVDVSSKLSGIIDNADLIYTSEIGTSAQKSILRVTLTPFVRQDNQIKRLVSFTVSIVETAGKLKSAAVGYTWKSSSVLGTGKWLKIKAKDRGIYKITYDQIKSWGFSNPEQVVIYGTNGYMLPLMNSSLQFDDLNTYPVWKGKDNAGKDCLFFFSTGNVEFIQDQLSGLYSHKQNSYTSETYFFLNDKGTSKIIGKVAEIGEAAGKKVFSFPKYDYYEKETVNLISSGSRWFGERFISGSIQNLNFTLDNPDLTVPANITIAAAGKSSAISSMDVALNGKNLNAIGFQAIEGSDPTNIFADDRVGVYSESLPSKNLQLRLAYQAANSSSEAWLDYVSINYKSLLSMNADVYAFRGKGVDGAVSVSELILTNASASTRIFDVTDPFNTFEVPATYADGQLKFKSNSAFVRDYVAFNPGGTIPSAELVGPVDNQNLHASDLSEMVIVANPALISAANDLANFHRQNDQMTVQVLTPEVIYNEFSGGNPDPAAFRNYFRMCYERGKQSGENTLKYVLLMGDGSYDNRNILGKGRNLIPTFQSENSLSPTESFVTDDFFVFLDEGEGGYSGTVDLGIGRLPAATLAEAEIVVDKIKNYNRKETLGNWRNIITFIGDDEDGSTHMDQAENLASAMNSSYPSFYAEKIYFDAFKQITTPGGEKYPDVNAAINNRVKQGTLVMNYTGHANEKNLADENVLDIGTINSWTNLNRLPVFVTATCEFSRFDGNETSAGEHILFNPNGGGIGLFSTTRLVYSGANFVLNSKFFRYIFEKDQQGNNLRLGDVMRLAKAAANTGTNQLNFTLLADPALRLAFPNYQVKTTSINGKNVDVQIDTIRNLSVVTVKGYVADSKGAKLSAFNGEIIPTVYDKAIQVKTLGNGGEEPMSYSMQSNIIYRGLATVKNGEFEFSFYVPKDVSYKAGKGKILYYAFNEEVDAQGYFDGFYIGGTTGSSLSDNKGPEIQLFMNSEDFRDGGQVSASSILIAKITDDSGINTAGVGIGHDITAVLDGDYSNILMLNDYFQASKDSYTSGTIVFPLNNLSEGEHTLKVKVWDVFNNSSEKEIRFTVKDDFLLESVTSYPNPMWSQSSFSFIHNQPDESFDVTLEVFSSMGARIDMLQQRVGSQGTQSLPIEWVPASRLVKMKPGPYIYRLTVSMADGKKSSISSKLVYVYR